MKDGELIGYMSGAAAFSSIGLTTQISSNILIGSNKYKRHIEREGYKISFLLQANPITSDNIQLLQILDAIKMIRKISGTSSTEDSRILMALIIELDEGQTAELERLSLKYTSYVRAIIRAILKFYGRPTGVVRRSVNGVSSYKITISESVLPTTQNGIFMTLHENKELFADAILAVSQAKEDGGLGIKQIFIEKDIGYQVR